GVLESGQTLTGQYTFVANGGDTTDKSTFLWSDGGQTGITTKTYSLNTSDVGKILTFTVTPVNGKSTAGTPVSINTKDAAGTGGGSGENPGEVIDPAARPAAENLNITGLLEVGQTLTGSYTFNPNGGDTTDRSTVSWDGRGTPATAMTYAIVAADTGHILTFTVTPVNGKNIAGTPVSVNTKDAAGVSGGDGNNPGEIINPGAVPLAENLDISGKLEVGQTLTGSYTFNPNGGDTTDKSTLAWSDGGQNGITTTTYSLNGSDVGKILTFTVTPKNGKDVTGTPVSVNTKDAAGVSGGDGGNPGEVIDPAAKPVVTADDITGKLEVGQTLTGHHTFRANGGDSRDASTFLWTDGGQNGITAKTYSLNASDIGKVLAFSVTAKNGVGVTGNTASISTKDAGGVTDGDTNNPGAVVDPAARPSADNLNITGKLEVGQTLTGSYTFNPNGGDTTDASTFAWDGAGTPVNQTAYGIVAGDVGHILTFSVTPVNGKNVTGTTVSTNTRDAAGVTGGDGDPGHKGEIIDPAAKPVVTADDITGKLEVGQTLTGHHTFNANGGDSRDASTFLWTDGGQSGNTATTYSLNATDIGKVLTFSVTAVNGAGVTGNTASISTKDATGVTDGDTNNPGAVVDPAAVPSAENLNISGLLEVGQTLTGSYTFNPNGGDTTDASTFAWDGAGTPVNQTAYGIVAGDVGKILTFAVTPKNGKNVTGTTVSTNTRDAAGVTGGDGDPGHKGEIIDPAAKPVVTVDDITGKLEVGQTLTGQYTFTPNGGDSRDTSTFAWTDGGQSGVTVKTYSLNASDVGKILTFSVTAVNGAGVTGNTDSISTRDAAGTTGGDTDNKGEVIDPAVPSAKHSVLSGNPLSITADGVMGSVLTFTAKNAGNEAITGLGNGVTFSPTGTPVTLTGVSEGTPGQYTATLTGTQAGTVSVSVSVNGQAVTVPAVTITLTAGTADTTHSSLTATPDSIVADNGLTAAGQSAVSLTLKDTQDNPVTGLTDVALSVAGVTGTTLTAVTESPAGSGVYTATLSGTTAGTATLTASAGGTALSGLQAQVILTPDITTATVSTVTETTGGAKADNVSTNTLTATVEDANGNRVPNATVDWSVTTGIATLSSATSSTDVNGQAIITVKDTTAETATVTAKVGSNAADAGQSTDTVFSLYPVVSGITQGVDGSPADNVTVNTLTVQIEDMAGNALANQAVTLSLSGTNLGTGPATLKHGATVLTAADSLTATTDGSGQLLLEATDITAESITVSAAVNNGSPGQTQSSAFGLYPILASLNIGDNNKPADNASWNSVIANVTDMKGNILKNTEVTLTFSADKGTVTFAESSPWTAVTDINGNLGPRLRDNTVESVQVTAGFVSGSKMAEVYFAPAITISTFNGGKTDGSQNGSVTALVTNPTTGNPLSGMPVTLSVVSGTASLATPSAVTDGSGQVVSLVNSSTQGPVTLQAATSGNKLAQRASGFLAPTFSGMTPPDSPMFALNSGFPTTGFVGAYFTMTLPSPFPTNATWTASNPSLLSIAQTTGVVSMIGEPGSGSLGTVTVSYPGVSVTSPAFTPNKWFKKTSVNQSGNYITDAPAQCAAMGNGYRQINVSDVTNAGIPSCNPGSLTRPRGAFPGTLGYLAGEFGGVVSFAADQGPSAQRCGNGNATLVWPYGSTGKSIAGQVSWSGIQTTSKYLCVRSN
ncbi:Ig-like domain-containing protein, partial [Citrobacter braakii]|uniref:beta strand repeat-containing protein n=1 Tax=Citrobacter braakii TaxID=57706 RepID=UPI002B3EB6D7